MEAGLMRHRITLQSLDDEQNELGEPGAWSDGATLWASVSPVSGREFMMAGQEHAEVSHKITIRYNRTVRPCMRVRLGARVFDILHIIDPQERHSEMTLMCREVVT